MNLLTKMRSWSCSLGIMLWPSTRTGCTTKTTIRRAIMPAKSTSRSNERNSLHKSPASTARMDERSSMTLMSLSYETARKDITAPLACQRTPHERNGRARRERRRTFARSGSMCDGPLQRRVNLRFQTLTEQKRLHVFDQKLLVLRVDRAQTVMVD